eukprot:CAMPEP_0114154822 /NCGR_PEP_ID=MMETSP0043_2-20121206/25125_1 /TAXON_ID=464988 /ORGANISM="Hemiselmis andersenii, Strain CCMP644" /LENGTH=130 /DNA_ID=CAMNT_0001250013 /DNA_START=257 /DNA_END=646 /DNA_ORIENTATION=-
MHVAVEGKEAGRRVGRGILPVAGGAVEGMRRVGVGGNVDGGMGAGGIVVGCLGGAEEEGRMAVPSRGVAPQHTEEDHTPHRPRAARDGDRPTPSVAALMGPAAGPLPHPAAMDAHSSVQLTHSLRPHPTA